MEGIILREYATKEELNKAFPNIKANFDKDSLECGNEDACELKEELLSGENSVITAEQAFHIAYEHCDRGKILEHYHYDYILENIVRAANSGEFEIEIEEKAWMLNYKPFKRLLEENGYKVYITRKRNNQFSAYIGWGHEY